MGVLLQILGGVVLVSALSVGVWFLVNNVSLKKENEKISNEKEKITDEN